MEFEMSKKDIRSRIEKIFSDILSDKHDMKITVKFRDIEEYNDDKSGSNKDASRYCINAGERNR